MTNRREAADHTDQARIQAEGLTQALYDMTIESTAIDHAHPEAVGMMAIIRALQDYVEQYGKRLDEERAA
ncbi:hypothetical protein [Tropicimonas sediminicola]|uniref:Uncharacterized protein n=1 Tax=Tropicimonas sediminicola TaxID=1031541 RepID=A0A239M553_9RHOB|nr:hypothetical protein [Tropicimonas sediminicola]SNT37997.1 hypothetical protein SAMN05421757_11360 [Tropicimonas sediminicola]